MVEEGAEDAIAQRNKVEARNLMQNLVYFRLDADCWS